MRKGLHSGLGAREREIMDVLHRLGSASVSEVRAQLSDDLSYSSVRTMLNLLESKGHARHEREGKRFIYRPTTAPAAARRSALRYVLDTFFRGSERELVAALVSEGRLDDAKRAELARLIRNAE